jgi:hypothetical protein
LHGEGGGQGQDRVLGQVVGEIAPVWELEEEQGEEGSGDAPGEDQGES